jgi:thiosulfate/3-mercaptopyruvate sulfurtransferase
VDCAYSLDRWEAGRELYLEAHVPGASFLGVELSDLSIEGQGRHPLPRDDDFAAAAGRAGIGDGVFVVAYDHGAAGGAARLWWLLRHFGHEEVAVLGGGFDSWLGPTRGGDEEVEPREFVARPRPGDTIDAEELGARLGEPGLVVVDARSPERYRGEIEPIDPVAGRIPGAVNWYFAEADEPPAELLEADEIVVYCGSGITACVDLLMLARAGREDAKLFPGSWSEWCARGLPVARG